VRSKSLNRLFYQKVTFFYKAHILAGQVRPDGKNICDFAWLTKQEITSRVDEKYWMGIKDMLSDV
jgi:large subunit ribosomal protein L46